MPPEAITATTLLALRIAPLVVVLIPWVKRAIWAQANLSGDHALAAEDVGNMVAAMASVLSLPATLTLAVFLSASQVCTVGLDSSSAIFAALAGLAFTIAALFVPPRWFVRMGWSVAIVTVAILADVTMQLPLGDRAGQLLCREASQLEVEVRHQGEAD